MRKINIWSHWDQIFIFRQIPQYSSKNNNFQKIQKLLIFSFILQVESTETDVYQKRTVHLEISKYTAISLKFKVEALQSDFNIWSKAKGESRNSDSDFENFENFKWTVLFRYTFDSVGSTCKMKLKTKSFWIFWKIIFLEENWGIWRKLNIWSRWDQRFIFRTSTFSVSRR